MWPSLAGKWISVVRSPASSRSKPNGRSKPKTPQRFDGKRPIFGASVAVRGGCLPPASKFCVAQSCVAWQTRAVGGLLQRACRGVPAQRHTFDGISRDEGVPRSNRKPLGAPRLQLPFTASLAIEAAVPERDRIGPLHAEYDGCRASAKKRGACRRALRGRAAQMGRQRVPLDAATIDTHEGRCPEG